MATSCLRLMAVGAYFLIAAYLLSQIPYVDAAERLLVDDSQASACPAPMIHKSCGSRCVPTCDNPNPGICAQWCKEGCFCPPDVPVLLRDGTCGTANQCDTKHECPHNLEWDECASACDATCKDPSPLCIAECRPKCACPADKPILLEDGTCGTADQCKQCPGNLVWSECGSRCNATCEDPNPACTLDCFSGCVCPGSHPIKLAPTLCGTQQQCTKGIQKRACSSLRQKRICKRRKDCLWVRQKCLSRNRRP